MSGPKNASINAGGFRVYEWVENGDTTQVLSVTSIRTLVGIPYNLVAWQQGNLLDVVMGTVKRPAMGKRGKPLKNRYTRKVETYPSDFVQRYLAIGTVQEDLDDDGQEYMRDVVAQEDMDELRKWVTARGDDPRNIAAARGTIVHSAIEHGVTAAQVDRDWVEAQFGELSDKDKRRVGSEVLDEDVEFVHDAVVQYEDMRREVPFVILAREAQIYNLTIGYGGSADAFVWVLGHWEGDEFVPIPDIDLDYLQKAADDGNVGAGQIKRVGGYVSMGDWKTSPEVYTDHVVQVTAYCMGEFVGWDGVRDERLTDILHLIRSGMLFKVRPDGWEVDDFDMAPEVMLAFAGSCTFARFLAFHEKPDDLFSRTRKGFAQ